MGSHLIPNLAGSGPFQNACLTSLCHRACSLHSAGAKSGGPGQNAVVPQVQYPGGVAHSPFFYEGAEVWNCGKRQDQEATFIFLFFIFFSLSLLAFYFFIFFNVSFIILR